MKKFRGQRRYYKNLLSDKDFESLEFDSWFDLWHTHPDWNGYGNISWKHRKSHIESLFQILNNLKSKLLNREEPYQLWGLINLSDSADDSVYIHSLNPNSENFPLKIEEVELDFKIPLPVQNLINESGFSWYQNRFDNGYEIVSNIVVYDESIGISPK